MRNPLLVEEKYSLFCVRKQIGKDNISQVFERNSKILAVNFNSLKLRMFSGLKPDYPKRYKEAQGLNQLFACVTHPILTTGKGYFEDGTPFVFKTTTIPRHQNHYLLAIKPKSPKPFSQSYGVSKLRKEGSIDLN